MCEKVSNKEHVKQLCCNFLFVSLVLYPLIHKNVTNSKQSNLI